MRVVRAIAGFQRDWSQNIGLVPTMGAFHEGHLQLMRRAKEQTDQVVVSLFVNPTQFGAGEDYARYPRSEARDFELAESVGVDVMFAPTAEEMYRDNATTVHVKEISEIWEGAYRPGHFDGVVTVVAKLFNIVQPNLAIFGEKDYQQCRVIERMVADLNVPVRLLFEPTVRAPDGLAMSSRNAYLSPEDRKTAPKLYEELSLLAERIVVSPHEVAIQVALDEATTALSRAGFRVDYLDLVDTSALMPTRDLSGERRVLAAVHLGGTRLIDNIAVVKSPN